MIPLNLKTSLYAALCTTLLGACGDNRDPLPSERYNVEAFQQTGAKVSVLDALDSLLFEVQVQGDAGSVAPIPAGQVDGAPVLGYVFPTTLDPTNVGFPSVDGIVALAVTSHPDFDDTPLWDEDANEQYDDDGKVYHTHWVVLQQDARAPAGLAVIQATTQEEQDKLPPTSPMAMYLDSPGFAVMETGNTLRVIVPLDRVQRNIDFSYDAVTAYMEVDASGDTPLLAVHKVYSVLSGDLSLPFTVENRDAAQETSLPPAGEEDGAFDLVDASVTLHPDIGLATFAVSTAETPATLVPEAAGTIDGAPVVGYAFPTNLSPKLAGFGDKQGILTLAITSHPDFDDTPLWDENIDGNYENDGATYHVHWVVLVEDTDSDADLSVPPTTDNSTLPPTAPMPMYLDSPGYHAFVSENTLRVLCHFRESVCPITFNTMLYRHKCASTPQKIKNQRSE